MDVTRKTISAGDVQLHVTAAGNGRPLLLVHGFPLDHSMWQNQIESLAERCFVIAPDLRGFGRSQVVPETATMEQMADDLAALLDALGVREPVVYCGLSMGGYIGWQFWRRHRRRLGQLVQCDTRAVADTEDVAKYRLETADQVLAEGPAALVDGMLDKLFAAVTRHRQPEVVEATRRVMLGTSPQGIASALRGMAQRPDVTRWLPSIDVPVLVLGGREDVISTPEELRGIAQAIPGARLELIPDAGHMAPLEQPQQVNRALLDFIGP